MMRSFDYGEKHRLRSRRSWAVYEHCVVDVALWGVLAEKNIFFLWSMAKGVFYYINLHGVHKLIYTKLSDRIEGVFMNIVKLYVVRVYKRVFRFAVSIGAHFMKLCTTWYFINLHELAIGDQRSALGGWHEVLAWMSLCFACGGGVLVPGVGLGDVGCEVDRRLR